MGNLYVPDPAWQIANYASTLCPVHPCHRLQVFFPQGAPPPAAGWPVVFYFNFGGFTGSDLLAAIGDSQLRLQTKLDAGYAVVDVAGPVSRGGNTGNATSSGTFNPSANQYGPSYPGNGIIRQATHAHFSDPTYFMPHKSAAMAVQFIVDKVNQGLLNLDLTKPVFMGRSEGAWIAAYLHLSPNMAPLMFPTGTGRDAISTRLPSLLAADALVGCFWPLYDLDGVNTSTGGHLDAASTYMFGQSIPGFPDTPADFFNQESVFIRLNTSLLQIGSSANGGTADATTTSQNRQKKAYLWSGTTATAGTPFSLANTNTSQAVQASNELTPLPAGGAELAIHSFWNPTAYKVEFNTVGNVRLVGGDTVQNNGQMDAVIVDQTAHYADETAFINAAFNFQWPPEATEPVEEIVVTAVASELKTIKVANGYRTDVAYVAEGEILLSGFPEYPAIAVQADRSTYDDSVFYPHTQETLSVGLFLAHQAWETQNEMTRRMIADVIKCLQTRFDTDRFGGLFRNFHVKTAERFLGAQGDSAFTGAAIGLEITYQFPLADPYTPA